MEWSRGRRSENVEDRRGLRVPGGAGGVGLGVVVLALIGAWITGADPSQIIGYFTNGSSESQPVEAAGPLQTTPQEEQQRDFVATVLGSTEDVWNELLPRQGVSYTDPTLVLYRGAVESACGLGESAIGPFYCPGDRKVYLDLGFFDELRRKLGAPGDFAQAYVIAHEVGHHVQNLLGISDKVHAQERNASEAARNALSVRLELQADYFAGVWAHHAERARHWLQAGDIEEGLNAARQIGDDNLQRRSQGRVVPESFTHGTSEQRVRWFRKGFESGDVSQGDTFAAKQL